MKKTAMTCFIFVIILPVFGQQIIHEQVYSAKMQKKVPVVIITPNIVKGKSYKTVYILHGYSGNSERTYQQDIPDLTTKSQLFQTIYILPDGNFNSWYVDSPIDTGSQYQTFIGDELVKYVDAHYPVVSNRASRGILGWSMGGYGAINIGVTFSHVFSLVGSSCGALDFAQFGEAYHQYQVDQVLGAYQQLDRSYLTSNKIGKMKNADQFYILDCGIEDEQMIGINRSFHNQLIEANVDHIYQESKGAHDTSYWSRSLSNQLALFENYFYYEKF
ncbi:alpha/beta hydrolase [Sphingobacterium faecium]|jgi:S-formylglutathione hydrolase FrmB